MLGSLGQLNWINLDMIECFIAITPKESSILRLSFFAKRLLRPQQVLSVRVFLGEEALGATQIVCLLVSLTRRLRGSQAPRGLLTFAVATDRRQVVGCLTCFLFRLLPEPFLWREEWSQLSIMLRLDIISWYALLALYVISHAVCLAYMAEASRLGDVGGNLLQ
jgi:hypothetical protein